MKKTLCLCFLLLPLLTLATHNRSGEITYRQTGVNTIELTITTYTKISPPSIQADRPNLQVQWGDGTPEETDEACGDIPIMITHTKTFASISGPNMDGSYDVSYTVQVVNNGGSAGSYDLDDTPTFDDDITINSGGYI